MYEFVYLGGLAGLVALAVSFVLATTVARLGGLVALGGVLAVAFLLYAYLSAPTEASKANCSSCAEYLGRWWDPGLTAAVLGANLAAWITGVLVAAGTRRIAIRARGST